MKTLGDKLAPGEKLRLVGSSGSIDQTGITEYKETWVCHWNEIFQRMPKPFSPHEIYTNLLVGKVTFEQTPAGYGKFTVPYSGLAPDGETDNEIVFDFQMTTHTAPIKTHPKFDSDFARYGAFTDGTDSDNNDVKLFKEFPVKQPSTGPNPGQPNPFAGQENFEYEGAQWSIQYVSASRPTGLSKFGKIDSPEGDAPQFDSLRNWRLTAFTFQRKGFVYSVSKTWTLSGPNGWNELVYK